MNKTFSILTIALLVSSTLVILEVAPVYADISFTPLPAAGVVSVEFVDSYAVYINDVYYVKSPQNQLLFNTDKTRRGTIVFLGSLAKDTPLEFQLVAKTDDPNNPYYTWSTNPANNKDGKDHIHIHQQAPPNTWLIEWEDQWNLGDNDFNDAIMTIRIEGDGDGDGLWDAWEGPNGADTNWDGVIELPRSDKFDPDPKHKDIFLEIDWMQGHHLKEDVVGWGPGVVNRLVTAFANAPVPNLDGKTGITLHVDESNEIPHSDFIQFGDIKPVPSGTADFDALKKTNFNDARRSVYHYCIIAHDQGGSPGRSGRGEGGGPPGSETGNDFFVTLGGLTTTGYPPNADIDGDGTIDTGVGTVADQANTVMHELGHNLGLAHGGKYEEPYDKYPNDQNNNKPNYISVMNYAFQPGFVSIGNPGTVALHCDYSRQKLPDLHEGSLNEAVGIQNGQDRTFFYGPDGNDHQGQGTGSIDWNCNGPIESSVSVDINNCGLPNKDRILSGYDDWDNIRYLFTDSGYFQDGYHIGTAPEMKQDLSLYLGVPIAEAGGPYVGDEGTPITFDASGSADPNGDPLLYRWDFDSDGVWDTGWSGPTASHTWYDDLTGGIATVQVYDGLSYDNDTADVTVNNVPPTVNAGPDQTVYSGNTVSFSGSFTDPGTLDTHTIEWDFGDGTPIATNTLTPTHMYLVAQDYTVTLTVTDDDGGVGVDTLTITVQRIPIPIDIKPGSYPNSINPGDKGLIPVAILNDASWTPYYINPVLVDSNSAVFGPNKASPLKWHYEDVDKDGDIDLILFFKTQETGISIGDTSATLDANLIDGRQITGVDNIWTAPRKQP